MSEVKNALLVEVEKCNLPAESAQSLVALFDPIFRAISEVEQEALAIQITSVDQERDMQRARELRLTLKKLRVEADGTRKELKEDSLRRGRAIDGVANVIKFKIVPLEEHLLRQEQFIARIEEERQQARILERAAKLEGFGVNPTLYKLGEMAEEEFADLLDSFEQRARAAAEAKKKAEADVKERAAEQERMRAENAALKAEREKIEAEREEERRKQQQAVAEAERVRRASERRAEEELQAGRERERVLQEAADEKLRKAEEEVVQERLLRERAEHQAIRQELAAVAAEERARAAAGQRDTASAPLQMASAGGMTREDIYDRHLKPLMDSVITVCTEHGIPMVAVFEIGHEERPGLLACTQLLKEEYGPSQRLIDVAAALEGDPDVNAKEATDG